MIMMVYVILVFISIGPTVTSGHQVAVVFQTPPGDYSIQIDLLWPKLVCASDYISPFITTESSHSQDTIRHGTKESMLKFYPAT